jgi:hypothetical protein
MCYNGGAVERLPQNRLAKVTAQAQRQGHHKEEIFKEGR